MRLALRIARSGLGARPRPQTVAERLRSLPQRGLPVDAPVEICWNGQLVPFIAAESDRDLAVALGLVQAHLRLAQMELMRRLAAGRLAEIVGAGAVPVDHALRLIDLRRAVPAIVAALPAPTRDWLDGFAAGINHHLAADVAPPFEFRVLGIAAAPWTVEDVLAIGRLMAADVNWLLWRRLLPLRMRPDWPQLWARLIADGTAAFASGSNALAVSRRRSVTGRPWLAGDPHLPITLPSVWLAAACRSPSYNVAGLMSPGLPAFVIGRNPHLAWGGTNLHAASSELFDVSPLPAAAISERRTAIAVRWSRSREVVLRDTAYGPIVSDHPFFPAKPGETLAMRWVGHAASDEITALLAMNRAQGAASFRKAAAGLAVPGQMLVFADGDGRIGRLAAARLPRRRAAPPRDLVAPLDAAAAWACSAAAATPPAAIDPAEGFAVSANERPPPGDIPIGWFFSPGDRAERLSELLGRRGRAGFADLAAILADVAAPPALAWRDWLCAGSSAAASRSPLVAALLAWDGRYEPGSDGALAFELLVAHLAAAAVPPDGRRLFGVVWHGRKLLQEEVGRLASERREEALRAALAAADPAFRRLRNWGRAHRLLLMHPFGRMPLIGRPYRFRDWAWPGSSETVFKSAHPPVSGRHAAGYGSNARYVFDLSDPDANRLVILGGQDGRPGSAAFLDQAELFRRGEYVEVPLRPETARARFPHRTLLEP